MVDFTSALYLGHYPLSVPFPPHVSVTTGKPAALYEPRLSQLVAQEVASKQGLERGLLASSTLHVFWDIVSLLDSSNVVLIDEGMYPVGRWGMMRATLQEVPVVSFSASDPERLKRLVYTYRQQNRTPWIVTDGWNMTHNKPVPLARYLDVLNPCKNSVLLVDDTQAFGILGQYPDADSPYGKGGGGCLPHLGIHSPKILTITSLSKGLGVPVAALAGSAKWIERYRQRSNTRTHTSPVSNLHAWAAWRALQTDRNNGDDRRNRLYQNVLLFQRTLRSAVTAGGFFPVQRLRLTRTSAVLAMYNRLKAKGIQSLLLANNQQPTVPEIAFCLRADHPPEAIMHTCHLIDAIVQENNSMYSKPRKHIHHEPLSTC